MKIPEIQQNFFRREWGWHFVHYDSGITSLLMSKTAAFSSAERYGGTVYRHPSARIWSLPRRFALAESGAEAVRISPVIDEEPALTPILA